MAAAAAMGLSMAFLLPAHAQFWDWGGGGRYQRFDPFRDMFGGFRRQEPRGGWGGEGDTSHAPAPGQKRPEVTIPIVVMGDANADWLAYGLEDSLSERPEIGIIRKHRTDSGLIRYDPRRDSAEWPQVAREIIAAEKPKVIVMMIGNNDRQSIREKAPPPPPRQGAPGTPGRPAATPPQQPAQAAHPPSPAPAAPAVDADAERQSEPPSPEQSRMTPEQARQASYGPWEFHTEKWEIAYIKRVDATISALKSAGVPVIWVGLPSQRNTKPSADSAYLNEIYRSRAEKAGITYVDIWDGFVDESGHYSPQGPDYEGQIRRLRSNDGVYFTKFGARKIAHYVQREIERHLVNRAVPVALPTPAESGAAANGKPSSPAQRPAVGPALPLTAANFGSDELVGGGRQPKSAGLDGTVTRVLTRGEPVAPPTGRADDFSWPPRGVNIDTNLPEAPPAPALPASDATDKQAAGKQQQPQAAMRAPGQRRPYGGGFQPFRLPFFGLFR